MTKGEILSEKTLIPLSMAFALVSFVFWISSVSFRTEANAEDIKEIQLEQKQYMEDVTKIRESLSRIEGAMGIKRAR